MNGSELNEMVERSGIANGVLPLSSDEVRQYFTRDNLCAVFGECDWSDETLETIAEHVVSNRPDLCRK